MKHCMNRVLRVMLITALVLVMVCAEALAMSIPCYINSNTSIYYRPWTSSAALYAPQGTSCNLCAYQGGWALVENSGHYAFIPLKYLNLRNPLTGYAARSTPLYRGPSSSSGRIMTIPTGTGMYVWNRYGDYFGVTDTSKRIAGFVPASYLTPYRPSTGAPAYNTNTQHFNNTGASGRAAQVLAVAQTLVGRPYSSDAQPPNSFDCSRFVWYCFGSIGVSVGHTSYDQGYDDRFAKITSMADLLPGDVVCFETENGDGDSSDHTGIYIGNGYFVHASSSAGKVIISTLSKDYYNRNFTWARRIV